VYQKNVNTTHVALLPFPKEKDAIFVFLKAEVYNKKIPSYNMSQINYLLNYLFVVFVDIVSLFILEVVTNCDQFGDITICDFQFP